MSQGAREVDIVVFGATGFTGKYVVRYLALRTGFSWGVAARSKDKTLEFLKQVEKETGKDLSHVEVFVADVADEPSVYAMAAAAKIIINCVGPFERLGEIVVKACVENSTHYVDITGEPLFIDSMILKYNDKAKEKGCIIVPSCGFDSIPADLGTYFAVSQFSGSNVCSSVESYLYVKPGPKGLVGNYGTYDSLIGGFSNVGHLLKLRKAMNRPKLPIIGSPLARSPPSYQFNSFFRRYVLPFPGADATVVRDSQFYFLENPQGNPKPVQFAAYFMFTSLWSVALLGLFDTVLKFFIRFRLGRYLLRRFPEFFTFGVVKKTGPTQEQIDGTSFTTTLIAKGYKNFDPQTSRFPDHKIVVQVAGPEPGYACTPICVCESALTILKEATGIPKGVVTPAAAFGKTNLIRRLNENGVTFSVLSKEDV